MNSLISKDASPSDKLDAILAHIANWTNPNNGIKNNTGGAIIEIQLCYANHSPDYFGLNNYLEMSFYLNTLYELGYIKKKYTDAFIHSGVTFHRKVEITFQGISRLHEIENKGALSNKCFVAMQFDEQKEARLNAIKESCNQYSYDAFIVENYHGEETMTIDAKIIAAIKSSKFCIADFSSMNQGAYFEAGYALGRGMKVIFICEQKDFEENKKHFDVNHYPFVVYKDFIDLTIKLTYQIGAFITK
jgi:hypothetical protein